MTNKTVKRYSESFKIQVVSEYESGSEISELKKKYGIAGGATITNWVKKYANEGLRHKVMRIQTAGEVNRIRELETKVAELEAALVKATLEKLAAECTLEVLEEAGVVTEEVKKNAATSSNRSKKLASKKGSS